MDGSSIAAEAGSVNYTFLENFVESIAQLISQGLTDRETERLLTSFSAFNERLRQLSYQNLTRLAKEAPYKRPYCKHHGTCTNNALRGFVRSFAVTYAIKYGLGFVPALITGQIYRKPGTLLKIGGRDTVSFALFLSTLISAYKGTLCACRRMFPKPDHQKMNAFIAGTVCGLSLLLDKNKSRRIMIALYLSTRTMHFMSRWVWRHYIEHLFESKEESVSSNGGTPHVSSDSLDRASSEENEDADDGIQMHKAAHVSAPPSVVEKLAANGNGPKPLTPISILKPAPKMKVSSSTDHGKSRASQVRKMMRSISGTIVMMLSSAQILYAYVAYPDTLAKSYLGFLIVHGNVSTLYPKKPRMLLDAIASVINNSSQTSSTKFIPDAADYISTIPEGIPTDKLVQMQEYFTRVPHEYILCGAQHPDYVECHNGWIKEFQCEWPRAFALYAPLNALMTIVFRGTRILKEPGRTLRSFIFQTLRSTLFLSGYVTTAWSLPCVFRRMVGKDHPWMYIVNGIFAGAWVMVENPGRRLELGLYCLPRAIQSLWNCWVQWGWVKNIPGGEALYFCLSMGMLMHFYQNDPESIHDGYRKIMVRFLGVN